MIIVMCGISGSGKSTMAEILAKRYNLPIISTDKIREEICGDASCQDKNGEVFKIAYARLEECAKDRGAIFDATNIPSVPFNSSNICLLIILYPWALQHSFIYGHPLQFFLSE